MKRLAQLASPCCVQQPLGGLRVKGGRRDGGLFARFAVVQLLGVLVDAPDELGVVEVLHRVHLGAQLDDLVLLRLHDLAHELDLLLLQADCSPQTGSVQRQVIEARGDQGLLVLHIMLR